jgi:hypothetical protein
MSDAHEIDLDRPPRAAGEAGRPEPAPAAAAGTRGLRVALVLAVLTAVGLGGWIWVDNRRTGAERGAVEAVIAYLDAFNAHDANGVRNAMAPRGGFGAGDNVRRPFIVAGVGPELNRLLDAVFAADGSLESTGRIEVQSPDALKITVQQRMSYTVYGVDVVEQGVSLFTLIEVDGRPKVYEHFWWRPYPARAPSILWTQTG